MTAYTRTAAPITSDTALEDFTERLFGHLPRADQRRWAQVYVQGLLSTPGKKSVRQLAAAVTESPTASQSLQQFVSASPWDWGPARLELLRWVEERHTAHAWTIGEAVLPKRGAHSVGVHRRFDPAAGRTVNCQLGFGLFLSLDGASVPVDWRLLLPETWSADPALRRRARISPDVAHQAPEALVLELIDSISAHTSSVRAPVVADLSRLPGAAALIGMLNRRGHDFLVSVPASLQVSSAPIACDRGEPGGAPRSTTTAGDFARLGHARHPYAALFAGPGGRPRRPPIHSGLVRVPGAETGAPGLRRTYRLFGERRPGAGPGSSRPGGPVWLTNMNHHQMDDLLHLVRRPAESAHALSSLAGDFGLLDFEGRSFPGWHHHMTLMSAAYAYESLSARRRQPAAAPQADADADADIDARRSA